jgi:hypothetical protein
MQSIRIRHLGDKQMYWGTAGWTLNRVAAREFATRLEAIAFVLQRNIGHAELVVDGPGSSETALPMGETTAAETRGCVGSE